MRPLLALLAALLLAGCAQPGDLATPTASGAFHVGGSFDANATQQDYDRAQGIATSYGGTLALLESFPVQFSATGFTDVACQKARDALAQEPHVASVGACGPATSSSSPSADPPTIAPPRGRRGLPLSLLDRGEVHDPLLGEDLVDDHATAVAPT